jgi:hypothetical protein
MVSSLYQSQPLKKLLKYQSFICNGKYIYLMVIIDALGETMNEAARKRTKTPGTTSLPVGDDP